MSLRAFWSVNLNASLLDFAQKFYKFIQMRSEDFSKSFNITYLPDIQTDYNLYKKLS